MSAAGSLALVAADSLAAAAATEGVDWLVGEAADWRFVLRNLDYLAGGVLLTVGLTVASILLGFIAGFPAGAVEVYGDGLPKRLVEPVGVVLRATPIVVILLVMYFVVGVPQVNLGVASISPAVSAPILGVGLRSAAYQSQIFRASLGSVDDGQLEAGRSVGLSRFEAIRYVVLPRALRYAIPSWTNEFVYLIKYSSLAGFITVPELYYRADRVATDTFRYTAIFLVLGAMYLCLVLTAAKFVARVDDRVAIPGLGADRER